LLCLASSFARAEGESSAVPAAWGLPQLMQSLAQVKSSQAKFT
jgi:hypothetical protein